MKRYKELLVKEIEHSDLDLEEPFYTGDHPNEVITDASVWSESESIDIDKAIETLDTLKKLGSTRVYIVAHGDHHGYVFTGIKLEEL